VAPGRDIKSTVNPAQHILVFGVRLYQWTARPLVVALSGPLGRCRFTPSCSEYAIDALRVHGALRGSALAAWRICRCNPWGACGDDPVPARASKAGEQAQTQTCCEGHALSGAGGGGK
jgi:putative membrane protein insertion efficiency factor